MSTPLDFSVPDIYSEASGDPVANVNGLCDEFGV